MPLFTPDRDKFADMFLRALAKRNLQGTYDSENFCIKVGDSNRYFLANAYTDYCRAPFWRRGQVISRYMFTEDKWAMDDPPSFEDARDNLMPKVRERSYGSLFALNKSVSNGREIDLVQRVFGGGHLTLEVVFDTPRFSRSIPSESLTNWGLTFDDALGIANENLKKRSVNGGFEILRQGLYLSTWRDTFDASRLQVQDFVTMLDVKGRYVAMIPNRDILIVTGEGDEEGLVAMAKLAEAALEQPRPMTGIAFRLDAGWVPFLPPEDHPAYKAFKLLRIRSTAGDYGEQKALLDQQNEKDGTDLFVASVMSYNDATGTPFTMSSWAQDVESLLPETDYVAFGGIDKDGERGIIGIADWADVIRVVPDLLEPQNIYPERYRTIGFPTHAQLDTIGLRERPR